MSTVVVNIKHGRFGPGAFDVYIGRAEARAGDERCHVTSEWANPYRVGMVGGKGCWAKSIEECVAKFERDLRDLVAIDHAKRDRLLTLEGKRLGCWCKPGPCHGDAIVRVIEELRGREAAKTEGLWTS